MKLYYTALIVGFFLLLGAVGGIENGTSLWTGGLIAVIGGMIGLWGAIGVKENSNDNV